MISLHTHKNFALIFTYKMMMVFNDIFEALVNFMLGQGPTHCWRTPNLSNWIITFYLTKYRAKYGADEFQIYLIGSSDSILESTGPNMVQPFSVRSVGPCKNNW